MDEKDKEELGALIIGFLQQSLKENPNGFNIRDFERIFPERCDEPRDWYKRYKLNSTLDALKCIPNVVKLISVNGNVLVSLNQRCDKVDNHLVDLITNQKSSGKRKTFNRPSSRAHLSFSLNRQYSPHYRRNTYTTRLNHDQQYRGENMFIKKDSPPASTFRPSIYNKAPSVRMASGDPRNRGSSSSMVPPQVKVAQSRASIATTASTSVTSKQIPSKTSNLTIPRPKSSSKPETKKVDDDPGMVAKKSRVRQRIVYLLTKKFPEIKILHLSSLYQLEFEEKLEPTELGHPNLTSLLQDPLISEHVQINYKSLLRTISARSRSEPTGKENVGSGDTVASPTGLNTNGVKLADASNNTSAKAKLDAIDAFNVRTMLQSLEPLGNIKEPPLKANDIDVGVKYKTMRIIFRSQNQTLRLNDWQTKFDQETRLQIRIRDYGFRTLVEFFKQLATELPIKIHLTNNEWLAVADMNMLSEWMNDQMMKGHYRAVTAIESHYELVSFPNDKYIYANAKSLSSDVYQPAFILSVKRSSYMWIQLRTPKMIEEHLCVEASMTGYEDYKNKGILTVPKAFIRPGFPCAVFDLTQQRWCRALVLKAPEIIDKNCEVTALLVDYAITKTYVASQLLCLMKSHLKLPVGPIYSKLAGVKESADGKMGSHNAKQVLQEYTSPPVTLAVKFLCSIPNYKEPDYLPEFFYEIRLVDTRSGKDCDLADDINLPRDSEE